jgi:hypothetical protein
MNGVLFFANPQWNSSNLVVEFKTKEIKEDLKYYRSKRHIQQLEKSKRQTLSMFGVTQWKPEKYTTKKIEGGSQLDIVGSYRDHKDQQIFFHERHIYYKNSRFQALLTTPKKATIEGIDREEMFQTAISRSVEESLK